MKKKTNDIDNKLVDNCNMLTSTGNVGVVKKGVK